MKSIALKIKAKNGVLQQFIDKKGWSQSEFARQAGVSLRTIASYFNMKGYPKNKGIIDKICRLVGETEEVIFPDFAKNKDFLDMNKEITYYKEIDPEFILEGGSLEMIEAPESRDIVPFQEEESLDLSQEVSSLLNKLSYREKYILTACFGLDGLPVKSIKEISEKLGLSSARIHQIKMRAVRRCSHPIISMKLEKFL